MSGQRACNKCGLKGHFTRKCRTKNNSNNTKRENSSNTQQLEAKRVKQDVERVQSIQDEDGYDSDVFYIATSDDNIEVMCNIGGVDCLGIIDSGCKSNLVGETTWKYLEAIQIVTIDKCQNPKKSFRSYTGHSLQVIGMFVAKLQIGKATFYVTKGNGKLLVGRETAINTGIL